MGWPVVPPLSRPKPFTPGGSFPYACATRHLGHRLGAGGLAGTLAPARRLPGIRRPATVSVRTDAAPRGPALSQQPRAAARGVSHPASVGPSAGYSPARACLLPPPTCRLGCAHGLGGHRPFFSWSPPLEGAARRRWTTAVTPHGSGVDPRRPAATCCRGYRYGIARGVWPPPVTAPGRSSGHSAWPQMGACFEALLSPAFGFRLGFRANLSPRSSEWNLPGFRERNEMTTVAAALPVRSIPRAVRTNALLRRNKDTTRYQRGGGAPPVP